MVLIGLGTWAVQAGYMEWREALDYWPILILIGAVEKLFCGKVGWGLFSLVLGGLLLLEEWRYFFLHDGWPLLLIMVGVGIAWEAIKPRRVSEIQGDEG